MTCIVALVRDGIVTMGGDALRTRGDGWDVVALDSPKVCRNGPFLMGACGDARVNQVLRYALAVPEQESQTSNDAYMALTFSNALRACLRDQYLLVNNEGREEGHTILVAYRGAIYIVDPLFSVLRSNDPYLAIGAGDNIALGAVAAMAEAPKFSTWTGPQIVERALRITERYSSGVGGPFTILQSHPTALGAEQEAA